MHNYEDYTLTLKLRNDMEGSLSFTVERAGRRVLEDLCPAAQTQAFPCAAYMLLRNDVAALDEWALYCLMYRAAEFRFTSPPARTLIQYFARPREWRSVTLSFRDADTLIVHCLPLNEAAQPHDALYGRRHMLVTGAAGHCGDWEIHRGTQRVLLGRALAGVLTRAAAPCAMSMSRYMAMLHQEDAMDFKDAVGGVGAAATVVTHRMMLPDGTVRRFATSMTAHAAGEEDAGRVLCYSRDITDDRAAQEPFTVRGEGGAFVVATNCSGVVTYASDSAYAFFGLTPGTLTGLGLNALPLPPESASEISKRFRCLRSRLLADNFTLKCLHRRGMPLWCDIHAHPVTNSKGALTEVVFTGRDVTDEKAYYRELDYMASHDQLTGLNNRFAFEREMLNLETTHAENFVLVMLDLNGLKLVNNTFGHNAGDRLLCELAQIMSNVFAGDHFIARIGGDEFAVISYNTSLERTEAMCKALKKAIGRRDPSALPLSVALGTAWRAIEPVPAANLLMLAESRMNNNKLLEHSSLHNQVIASLLAALKEKNVETAEHMKRVQLLAMRIAERLGLSINEQDRLMLLATMHDIGKMGIPEHIIGKPGKLSPDEWAVMRTHSEIGYRIAKSTPELSDIADEICSHHEYYNGEGYPYKRKGEDIPLLSRIISVVDTYDVMTNRRIYKDSSTHDESINELKRCAGTQFDPEIVLMFEDIIARESLAR